MSSHRLALAGVVFFLGLGAARAEIRMPGGKALPDKIPTPGVPAMVWIAHEGYVPLEFPKEGEARVTLAEPLRFMEMCYKVTFHQEGANVWWLLAKCDPNSLERVQKHVGWVEQRHLIQKNEAETDPATNIHRKALLVVSEDVLKQVKDREKLNVPVRLLWSSLVGGWVGTVKDPEKLNVPVRLAPMASAPAKDAFRFLHIYFVYADTDPRERSKGYLLLGIAPDFAPLSDPTRVVYGWVEKMWACRWDKREGFEWDMDSTLERRHPRRTLPGQVYETVEDAHEALANPRRVGTMVEKKIDGKSVAWPHDRMRFPLLPPPERKENEKQLQVPGNQLYHVGGVTTIGGSQEENEDYRRRLGILKKQQDHTEILFVIDDTKSMGEHFEGAARAAHDIIKDVRSRKTGSVHIGLTFFNDVDDEAQAHEAIKPFRVGPKGQRILYDAKSAQADALVKHLLAHKDGGGGDPLERVFLGITRGIHLAQFEPNARKLVILIGDCGDKCAEVRNPTDNREREEMLRREEAAIQALSKHLVPEDQSLIEFYAIQVVPAQKNGPLGAEADFHRQANSLIDLCRKKTGIADLGMYVQLGDTERLRAGILGRYELLRKKTEALQQEIAALEKGDPNTAPTPQLRHLLEVNDLMPKNVWQFLRYGYLWLNSAEHAKIPQVRLRLLVNGEELEQYLHFLSPLRKPLAGKVHPRDLVIQCVEKATGEKIDLKDKEKSFKRAVQMSRGLTALSWLLQAGIDNIQDSKETWQELFVVRRKLDKLDDMLKEQHYEYKAKPLDKRLTGGLEIMEWVRVGEPERVPRAFHLAGNETARWYWVDFLEEWP